MLNPVPLELTPKKQTKK